MVPRNATALLTVQTPSERLRRLERTAIFGAFTLSLLCLVLAIVTALQGHPGFFFPVVMFGVLVLFASIGDRRMLGAGGLHGSARLRRHLWRMCTALFIAAASFLGPARRIPEPLRIAPFRLLPLLVLLTMAYWLWRYRRKRPVAAAGAAEAI